ncbi:MAG: hypothetical protein A2252_12610 [Elusimicrobia bacterium RIFOXYA2_FULL_39_19]|nr:MAG: hypothetical protein A2252_12610 [Elusimicrobia bacterium RIFOXYA2_FULL_39_19]
MKPKKLSELIIAIIIVLVSVISFKYSYVFFKVSPVALLNSILFDLSFINPTAFKFIILHLLKFLLVLPLFCCAWFIGNTLLRLLKINILKPAEQAVLSITIGTGVLGYCIFILASIHQLNKTAVSVFICMLFIVSLFFTASGLIKNRKYTTIRIPAITVNIYQFLLIPFILLNFLSTFFPEIFFDALVYHLAIPANYIQNHGLINLPHNIFSCLPNLSGMVFSYGLIFHDIYLVKIINFYLGSLLLYSIYIKGRGPALLMFLSIPITALNLWCTGSDILMTLFLFWAVALYALWFYKNKNVKLLYLSAFLLGLALSTKYTAGFCIPILLAGIIYKHKNNRLADITTVTAGFISIIFLLLIPWWLKNYVYCGNPFFPYLTNLFGTGTFSSETLNNYLLDARHGYSGLTSSINGLRNLVGSAFFATGEGRAGFTGPVFLMLLPFLFFGFKNAKLRHASYLFSSVLLIWLFSTHMIRHLVPFLLFLFIPVSLRLYHRRNLSTLLALLLALNFYWLLVIFQTKYHGLKIITGQINTETYLYMEHPGIYRTPSYKAYTFLKSACAVTPGKVLLAGETRQFYCDVPSICSSPYDKPYLFELMEQSADLKDMANRFKTQNIRYILFNKLEFIRLTPARFREKKYISALNKFLGSYTVKIYNDNFVDIYEIKM